MCARFTLKSRADELVDAFELAESPQLLQPRYNIAPGQQLQVIANLRGPRVLRPARWGLIPYWAKDASIANKLVNARSETVAEKPSFRDAFRFRRCLVPASGFYEWQRRANTKRPMHIGLASGAPFAMAGLWEVWRSPDGADIQTCTLLTTTPNAMMSPIHDRMPVIVPPDAWSLWLAPQDPGRHTLQQLLRPFPADEMRAYEVSPLVNSVRNDLPACAEPVQRLL
ncbi:MAG: SOS response-associated peptidase [Myxococcales bacterium]|nr:SOS response-associated peptidase [Myxococcales bacterium]